MAFAAGHYSVGIGALLVHRQDVLGLIYPGLGEFNSGYKGLKALAGLFTPQLASFD